MPARVDTYKYHFKVGGKIVHLGTTGDLARRESELRRRDGWIKGRIKQVGDKTTRDGALSWELHQSWKDGRSSDYEEWRYPNGRPNAQRAAI